MTDDTTARNRANVQRLLQTIERGVSHCLEHHLFDTAPNPTAAYKAHLDWYADMLETHWVQEWGKLSLLHKDYRTGTLDLYVVPNKQVEPIHVPINIPPGWTINEFDEFCPDP